MVGRYSCASFCGAGDKTSLINLCGKSLSFAAHDGRRSSTMHTLHLPLNGSQSLCKKNNGFACCRLAGLGTRVGLQFFQPFLRCLLSVCQCVDLSVRPSLLPNTGSVDSLWLNNPVKVTRKRGVHCLSVAMHKTTNCTFGFTVDQESWWSPKGFLKDG